MTGPRKEHPCVLVVDPRADARVAARERLLSAGYRALDADTGRAALDLLAAENVQVLVVDGGTNDPTVTELVDRARANDPLLQVILQTIDTAASPPDALLWRLDIHGYHDRADGLERLCLAVDAAVRAHGRLSGLHVAERLKTELLANVSHELRNPLGVIVGYLDLLRDGTFGALPPEADAVISKVRGNATYLLQLVHEFLGFSKLETGADWRRRERIALTPFLRELGESFAVLVRTKSLEFEMDVPDGLPTLTLETAKLRIVVQNLLSNAEKFTTHGRVCLAARHGPDARVAISVSDTGPGIAPEHHEAIFDLFRQLDGTSAPGGRHGLGLGLALARRFTRLMAGDISIASRLGEGTTFTVHLPTGTAAHPEEPAAASPRREL